MGRGCLTVSWLKMPVSPAPSLAQGFPPFIFVPGKAWFIIADRIICFHMVELSSTEKALVLLTMALFLAFAWQKRKNRLLKERMAKKTAEWQQAMQTKNKMITTLSHEVLTPLRVIAVVARREIAEAYLPGTVRESLEKIGRTADMLYHISLNVVSWMKYQEDNLVLMKEKVFPAEVAERAMDLLLGAAGSKNDKVMNRIPADIYLYTDKMILQIILLNLLSNSIRFTTGGEIIFDGRYEDGMLKITVQDTGIGFRQDILQNLRSSSHAIMSTPGSQGEQGHGMGYTIIMHFLKMLGGSLEVQSRSGEGAAVSIRLQRAS
jgi:signal transduction histidine kinase